MQEKWIRWEPTSRLSAKYYVESIVDIDEGFKIILYDCKHSEKKTMILFPDSVDAYRRTDESFTLSTLHSLKENYGINFFGDWSFFKIENSEYLDWIKKQSFSISESLNFQHFCILASDFMIDIITNYEPEVSHIEPNK